MSISIWIIVIIIINIVFQEKNQYKYT